MNKYSSVIKHFYVLALPILSSLAASQPSFYRIEKDQVKADGISDNTAHGNPQ